MKGNGILDVNEGRPTSGYEHTTHTAMRKSSAHSRGGRNGIAENATKGSSELVTPAQDIRTKSPSESDSVASRSRGVAETSEIAPGDDHDDKASLQ